jgi:hypothetical protein
VTITSDDRERYQTAVGDFHTQPEPDNCLPTALKNILDELADRKDEPNLRYSVSDLGEALDYVKIAPQPLTGWLHVLILFSKRLAGR